MKLRSQLLLITLLVILIPIAGWQFVQGLEQSLRQAHEQTLIDSASAIARTLAAELPESWQGPSDGLYVHRLEGRIHLDGHGGEWDRWLDQAHRLQTTGDTLRARLLLAARPDGRLYLMLRVDDASLVFGDPDRGPGDRVEILIGRGDRSSRVELAPLAPGWIEAQDDTGATRVQGNWQPRTGGWNLELQMVEPAWPDRLELTVHDVDDPLTRTVASRAGTRGVEPLVYRQQPLEDQLARLLPDNTQAWATTNDGWVLAHHDARTEARRPDGPAPVLFERLLGDRLQPRQPMGEHSARWIDQDMADGVHATWMSTDDDTGVAVIASVPVIAGADRLGRVILERNADEFLILANQAVLRLFGTSLLVLVLIAGLLIGFAALLSERIRRLRNRTEAAVLPDGRVLKPIATPRAQDEIGDLGRSMAELIRRQYHHQDYLRTLADKLSHELRTPLATIRSSLDNLSQVDEADERERYRQRAEDGCQRLGAILQSMSQAARVEEALDSESFVTVDMQKLLEDYVAGCSMAFPDRRFDLSLDTTARLAIRLGSSRPAGPDARQADRKRRGFQSAPEPDQLAAASARATGGAPGGQSGATHCRRRQGLPVRFHGLASPGSTMVTASTWGLACISPASSCVTIAARSVPWHCTTAVASRFACPRSTRFRDCGNGDT
jgi:two-component system, OmpR family, sensor histidine kinase ChvG